MADNTVINPGTSGDSIATDDISGIKFQRVKLIHGADGVNDGDVSTANRFPVKGSTSATATLTNVNDTASSTTVLASNANRLGATFFNDSTSLLYLKFGATASTTSFTTQIQPGGYFELPGPAIYTGVIDGIWSADASGAVRITELT